jgi:hypothetical protein
MKRIAVLFLIFLINPALGAEDAAPQGRPGVVRGPDNKCFQTTDIYGDFRDEGREVPCDDRYKEAEEIAWWEFGWKTNLKMYNGPRERANWEAWQASAASGATTLQARMDAYDAEIRKQAEQHADVSKPFLSGRCQPTSKGEETNAKNLELGCQFDSSNFQRNYWLALQGDHGAQEEIASCFGEGAGPPADLVAQRPCHRVVLPNETQMCAWLLVAASSGHPKSADSAEEYGYVWQCDKKPLYVRQAILGTASDLFQRIYHRYISHAILL